MKCAVCNMADPHCTHQVVAWLWETVAALEPEEQRKFLKFVSGSDRAPIGGLANLRCTIQVGDSWKQQALPTADLRPCKTDLCGTTQRVSANQANTHAFFTLSASPAFADVSTDGGCMVMQGDGGDSNKLPTSHTCFNTLLLPAYVSKDKLQERLRLAIMNAEGFGLE